jgi:hypothetical protein
MEDKYYKNIKELLINNEVYKRVKDYSKNKSDLTTYYNVGKELSEAGNHYGEGIISKYSAKLTKEFGKGYGKRNLWLMLRFYLLNEKIEEIQYYINITEKQTLTIRQLREKIKNREYQIIIQ